MDNRENAIGFHIRELNNALRKSREQCNQNSEIKDITMMHQWIIGYLASNTDHDVHQRELETELNIGKSTLTEVLNIMEKNDLVIRISSEKDARCKKIVLTEKSIRIDSEISQKIKATEEKLRKGITEEEIELFLKNIKKMIANISED